MCHFGHPYAPYVEAALALFPGTKAAHQPRLFLCTVEDFTCIIITSSVKKKTLVVPLLILHVLYLTFEVVSTSASRSLNLDCLVLCALRTN